jgi:hypothetical protein
MFSRVDSARLLLCSRDRDRATESRRRDLHRSSTRSKEAGRRGWEATTADTAQSRDIIHEKKSAARGDGLTFLMYWSSARRTAKVKNQLQAVDAQALSAFSPMLKAGRHRGRRSGTRQGAAGEPLPLSDGGEHLSGGGGLLSSGRHAELGTVAGRGSTAGREGERGESAARADGSGLETEIGESSPICIGESNGVLRLICMLHSRGAQIQ